MFLLQFAVRVDRRNGESFLKHEAVNDVPKAMQQVNSIHTAKVFNACIMMCLCS